MHARGGSVCVLCCEVDGLQLRAVRPVLQGEELTVAYVDPLTPRVVRACVLVQCVPR